MLSWRHLVLCVVCLLSFSRRVDAVIFPEASCFEKPIPEGGSLTCKCKANSTDRASPQLSFSWPGHSSSPLLRLDSVRREDSGRNYTCLMQGPGASNQSVTYTLQVVYGPFDGNTTIIGPSTFITDGSREVNLTCSATNANPAPGISWTFVTCQPSSAPGSCVFVPSLPRRGEEVKAIVCTATNPVITDSGVVTQSSATFYLHLSYPPAVSPVISTTTTGVVMKSRNTITCTVPGGSPLVKAVIFNCTNPTLPDRADVIGAGNTSVSSSVIVDTSEATAGYMECVCSAVWAPEPDLYLNTSRARFLLEYKAAINNFTLNSSTEITVLEENQSTIVFHCDVTGRPSTVVRLRKQGNDTLFGQTADVTDNWSDVARRMVLTYAVTSARCEDSGTFTCLADSGFLDVSTESVRLSVLCAPRYYNGSFDPPPELTSTGLVLHLVAYPVPQRFHFSLAYNDTAQWAGLDDLFETQCHRHDYVTHLVTCMLKRREITEKYFGVYNVTISNAFGDFLFRMTVGTAVKDRTVSAGTAALIVGLTAATVAVVVVFFIVFIVRQKRTRDVECTRVSHRRSLHGTYPDNDPSIPFAEVFPAPFSDSQCATDRSNSPLPFVEVVPFPSDVYFMESDRRYSPVGSTKTHDDHAQFTYSTVAGESGTGNTSEQLSYHSGTSYTLESDKAKFITNIFLPKESGTDESSGDSVRGELKRSHGPLGDQYAQVSKAWKGGHSPLDAREAAGNVRSGQQFHSTEAGAEDELDISDTEEEKWATMELGEEGPETSEMEEDKPRMTEEGENKIETGEKREERSKSADKKQEVPDIAKKKEEVPEIAKKKEEVPAITKKKEEIPEIAKNKKEMSENAKKKEGIPEIAKNKKEMSDNAQKKEEIPEIAKKKEEMSEIAKNKAKAPEIAKKKEEVPEVAKKKDEMTEAAKTEKEKSKAGGTKEVKPESASKEDDEQGIAQKGKEPGDAYKAKSQPENAEREDEERTETANKEHGRPPNSAKSEIRSALVTDELSSGHETRNETADKGEDNQGTSGRNTSHSREDKKEAQGEVTDRNEESLADLKDGAEKMPESAGKEHDSEAGDRQKETQHAAEETPKVDDKERKKPEPKKRKSKRLVLKKKPKRLNTDDNEEAKILEIGGNEEEELKDW